MKRAFLIAGGTISGLGAVLAITPPQLSAQESTLALGDTQPVTTDSTATGAGASNGGSTTTNASTTTTNSGTTQQSAAPKASASAAATKSANTTATTAPTASATPKATASATPTATKAAATSGKSLNGSFTGDASTMRYGTVQVQVVISGGKITDVVTLQAPGGRDQRYTDMCVPVLRQRVIAAQSSNITGVAGASYTGYAYWTSLQSALKKAGWL